jgi:hypothetical protein
VKALIQLLSELRAAQVCLWSEGEQLRYRAPRGALTAELLAELKECKAELIAFCRQTQGAQASFTLAPVARDGDLPISLAQHRLWVLDRLDGQSAAYNIPLTLRLRGNLDVAALRESFADLLRRHESLRTAIEERDGEGRAAIVAHARVPWTQVDVRHVPRESRLETVRGLAREEALRPFDLGRAPLIRIALWQLDAGHCIYAMRISPGTSAAG